MSESKPFLKSNIVNIGPDVDLVIIQTKSKKVVASPERFCECVTICEGKDFNKIAAAPEIYEACKKLMDELESMSPLNILNIPAPIYSLIENIKQAIAKAEGKS